MPFSVNEKMSENERMTKFLVLAPSNLYFYCRHVYIPVFFHAFVCPLLLQWMFKVERVACGSEDVAQYSILTYTAYLLYLLTAYLLTAYLLTQYSILTNSILQWRIHFSMGGSNRRVGPSPVEYQKWSAFVARRGFPLRSVQSRIARHGQVSVWEGWPTIDFE